jgi:tripeptidyl-peptidase-1
MLLPQSFVVVAIAVLASSAPASIKHVLHEERQFPPSDYRKGTRIEGSAILPMRIGLTQTNLENGYDHLMDV